MAIDFKGVRFIIDFNENAIFTINPDIPALFSNILSNASSDVITGENI